MRLWLSKHPLIAAVLLIGSILAVYFPAIQSGIHPIDDPGILSRYSSSLPLSQVLLPGSGYYYRPLVELSFWFDNLLWGMEPHTMHLENVLLHCANTLLLFSLARYVVNKDTNILFPFAAALLFALHPINVEAVVWIAGRTDPLLTLFVLSSLIFWLRWVSTPRQQDMSAALLLFGAALLTKETAIAFGAFAVLLVFAWPGGATVRQRILAAALMVLSVALLAIVTLFFQSGTSGLVRFLATTDLQAMQAMQAALTALGFYLKKLLIPFPLNFAIHSVDPAYALAGVLFFPFVWWMAGHQRKAALLFGAAVLCLLPAVLVAIKQVAWTLFAERYLYLPSAFFVLGISVLVSEARESYKKIIVPVAACLVLLFFVISLQRTILWNDKLAFFEDAVAKSPGFGSVYYSLGCLLAQKGDIIRATESFHTAERLNQRDSMRYPIKAAIMGTLLAKGEYHNARDYFSSLFNKKQDAPAEFLELLYKTDTKRLEQLAGNEKVLLAVDIIETLALLNQKQADPFWLYQSGRVALIMGDRSKAANFFRQAYSSAPLDAHYRGAALTNLRRLEQGK